MKRERQEREAKILREEKERKIRMEEEREEKER